MKTISIIFLITTLLFILLSIVSSQTTPRVSFFYDQAGNRLTRTVILAPSYIKKHTGHDEAPDSVAVASQFGDITITVFPNPTKGALAVEVMGGNVDDRVKVVLHTSEGRQLQTIEGNAGIIPVDMTQYASGCYVLRIYAGVNVTDFKVIKQ
jgi:hypothetical protein